MAPKEQTVTTAGGDSKVLAALPKMPKSARKDRPKHDCGCGCAGQTANNFLPGHDSRLRGWALRIQADVVKLKDVPDGERQKVTAFMKSLPEGTTITAHTPVAPPKVKKAVTAKVAAAPVAAQPVAAAKAKK